MSYGLQCFNSSGVTIFDSLRIGRVVLAFFISPAQPSGGSYSNIYLIPAGKTVELYCTPGGIWSPAWRTYFSTTYSASSVTITFNAPTITSIFHVLVLLK